jgi:hypothetical protein
MFIRSTSALFTLAKCEKWGSSGRATAQQVQGLEFKLQYHHKIPPKNMTDELK